MAEVKKLVKGGKLSSSLKTSVALMEQNGIKVQVFKSTIFINLLKKKIKKN